MKHIKVKFSLREDQVEAIYRIAFNRAVQEKTYKSDASEVLRGIIDLVLKDLESNKNKRGKNARKHT